MVWPLCCASPYAEHGAAKCAKGSGSPEAPTEPWLGMTGITSRASNASSMAIVAGRKPDAPRRGSQAFSAIISRTLAGRIGSPSRRRGRHDVALERDEPPDRCARWQASRNRY